MYDTFANINTLWSQVIADELARSGVRDVVISPGSRSTPLVLACAAHPDLHDHSMIDERSAGFFALGIAKATGRPVALVCTSGTAAANYYPAVCEADASDVPLLLLTADRPAHLRHSGAPQMMDQVNLYGDRVRHDVDFAQPEADDARLVALRAAVCHAVAMSAFPVAGPVHCNVPFRKPLEPIPAQRESDGVAQVFAERDVPSLRGRRSGRAWTEYLTADESLAAVADMLLAARRPLIIAGPDADGERYVDVLAALSAEQHIPVFAEAASQQRFQGFGDAVGSADLLLRSARFREECVPDCVICLGGTATGAGMLRFLEQLGDIDVIAVAPGMKRHDPAGAVSFHVTGEPGAFLSALRSLLEGRPSPERAEWAEFISRADAAARESLARQLPVAGEKLEGAWIAALGELLPEGTPLMISSSMPVRDVESFLPRLRTHVPVFVNRGVNGIDGVLSTALGIAHGSGRRAVLLVGDIAFLHDLNAFVGGGLAALPLTIVLLDNDGGEIFDLLPVRDFDPAFTRHFLTPHGVDIAAVAGSLGLPVYAPRRLDELATVFAAAHAEPGCSVIHVRTTISDSGTVRRTLVKAVAADVDSALQGSSVPLAESPDTYGMFLRRMRRGKGIPVILLHGFTRSGASWEALAGGMDGHDVYAIDLIGHGRSPRPRSLDAYTLESMAAQIEALCRRWGWDRIHLVGYSLGGRVAMAFAARSTERLASLALLSAHPGMEDSAERDRRRETDEDLARRIETDGLRRFVDDWSGGAMFGGQRDADPPEWQRVRRDRLSRQSSALAASLRGCGQGRQDSYWELLPALTVPLLYAVGADDARYAEAAARLKQVLPSAVTVLDGAGHDVLFDRGEEVLALLRSLWKRA